MCYRKMSPPICIVLLLSLGFSFLATLLMVIAVATDFWETIDYDVAKLKLQDGFIESESNLIDEQGLYKVVIEDSSTSESNRTKEILTIRHTYGGIWRSCDEISDAFRGDAEFDTMLAEAPYLKWDCFRYIPDYDSRKNELTDDGQWLVRMMNSSASCTIVCLLCLFTAFLTGTFGVLQKQITACMVTGVMYMLAAVFCCFTLVIMHTKINYMQDDCYELDPVTLKKPHMCNARDVTVGWSVPVAWLSFCFLLFSFALWLLLTRCLRLEKAKTII